MRKQIPILFSTSMVQAILDGRKTMTRRVVKFPLKCPTHQLSIGDSDNPPPVSWSKWQPGDILWVRENFKMTGWDFEDSTAVIEFCTGESQEFETPDGDDEAYTWIVKQFEKLLSKEIIKPGEEEEGPMKFTGKNHPWSPSIHIPKWCSRIWLEVTNVRVERLHDMDGATADECDSLQEGIMKFHHGDGNYGYHWKGDMDGKNFVHPFDAFVDLWKSINGQESWEANPWVWVVEFKILSTTGKPSDI